MCEAKTPPKRRVWASGGKAPSIGSVCVYLTVYIDSPRERL